MKTLVVKVGSSTVADEKLRLRRRLLAGLVAQLAGLVHEGVRVVLVSSGAIACGQQVLGGAERPRQMPALQAASAVGQGRLFGLYERLVRRPRADRRPGAAHRDDFARATSYLNARNTLSRLLDWGVVPIVNENDTTATDEIRFGDNDALAAQVAMLVRADLLVLLTDTDGLYTGRPAATPMRRLVRPHQRPAELAALESAGRRRGAAAWAARSRRPLMATGGGVAPVIAHGSRPGVLADAVAGRGCRHRSAPRRPARRPSSSGCATPNRAWYA